MHVSALAGAMAGLLAGVNALTPIEAKGSKLFTNGNQFFIKGVAYQLNGGDPLIDDAQCQRDATLMQSIGTNSIRVYHVDPSYNHDACMKTFADAGIYLWLDLDTWGTGIDQNDPHWTAKMLGLYEAVMDNFIGYDNLAGFFVGNEVMTYPNGSMAAPYVKAAARDMKAYRDRKGYRKALVGYSAADIGSLRPMLQNYLACGSDFADSIDFFSLNAYEWCGMSSYEQSGYAALTHDASHYPVPIFFSETGCNQPDPRSFDDQVAILGPDMNTVWSGAIIYEWIQEGNLYGLVQYGTSNDPAKNPTSGVPIPIQPDFDNLSKHWKNLNPVGVKEADYQPQNAAPPCPAYTPNVWEVNGDVPLPVVGQDIPPAQYSVITPPPVPQQTPPPSAALGASNTNPSGSGSSTPGTGTSSGSKSRSSGAAVAAITMGPEIRAGALGLVGVAIGMALL